MKTVESPWGEERGYHLYKISENALRMIVERIGLENSGRSLYSLPLCTEEECVYIEEFIPRAKEGFVLDFKSSRSTMAQDVDLLKIANFSPVSFSGKVKLSDRQNTLPEYAHALATLATLSISGKVSFFQFPDPPSNIDYNTGIRESSWFNSTDTFENVWNILDELEDLTRKALYSSQPMVGMDMLRLGHFFMTAKTISSIFDN